MNYYYDPLNRLAVRGLAFTVAGLLALEYVPTYVLANAWRRNVSWTAASIQLFYPMFTLYVLLLMLFVIWFYSRHILYLRRIASDSPKPRRVFRNASLGLIAGVLLALFMIPIVSHVPSSRLFVSALLSCSFCLQTAFLAFMLVIALPVATEVVFRLIVQETLMRSLRPVEVVLINAFLLGLLWPVLGFWVGFGLGVTTSILYYCKRSLIMCIFVNATMTACLGLYLVIMTLRVLP